MVDSPFWHYNGLFDAAQLIAKYAAGPQMPVSERFVSYFGVVIDPRIFPAILGDRVGEVEREMIPANWHADLAEFGAALRAVDLAKNSFAMVELGCGWGCWMNLTGTAARRAGLDVSLIGVEGDSDHIAFAHQSMAENGFADTQYKIFDGIAAAKAGEALFPSQEGGHWGLSPVFHSTPEQRQEALASGHYHVLPMVPLSTVATGYDKIDLLHMDIQGGEADLVADALEFLGARVAYIVIGTHSRQIEGRLWDLLSNAGWLLEIERPALFMNHGMKLEVSVDGVQGWRNLSLLPV